MHTDKELSAMRKSAEYNRAEARRHGTLAIGYALTNEPADAKCFAKMAVTDAKRALALEAVLAANDGPRKHYLHRPECACESAALEECLVACIEIIRANPETDAAIVERLRTDRRLAEKFAKVIFGGAE